YNVYRLNPDNSRTFLWATPNSACFVPEVTRPLSEDQTEILVEAVSNEFGYSAAVSTTIDWVTTGIQGNHGNVTFQGSVCNPVSGSTSIGFSIPEEGRVSLRVFDLAGRMVQELTDDHFTRGSHSVDWTASQLPSGLYVLRLETAAGSFSRKCMVID
ncbi:MAG: T9SS type A sorting domain-containing protein, partial [Candidatus Aegiribacteria sp.]|nr:T9SS type A sorting domain-containing protein [Candidatus Aegiribacteria sp.]MBD3294930.1 T9SS type A sorting domain-containing protein [Candidatus Fermentibacteria bacterium]